MFRTRSSLLSASVEGVTGRAGAKGKCNGMFKFAQGNNRGRLTVFNWDKSGVGVRARLLARSISIETSTRCLRWCGNELATGGREDKKLRDDTRRLRGLFSFFLFLLFFPFFSFFFSSDRVESPTHRYYWKMQDRVTQGGDAGRAAWKLFIRLNYQLDEYAKKRERKRERE